MSFDKLMAELQEEQTAQEALAKALPADDGNDDQTIAAAAEDGGDGEGKKSTMVDKDEKIEDGKPMAKSFKVKLEDGTEVEAVDGEAMIKSLTERLDSTESTLAKAMEQAVGLIKGQSAMIKSLSERVAKMAGEGRGRKAVVVVNDKQDTTQQPLKKSDDTGMTPAIFMAKAMDALGAGRLTSLDISLAEACINSGKPVPGDLVQRVMA